MFGRKNILLTARCKFRIRLNNLCHLLFDLDGDLRKNNGIQSAHGLKFDFSNYSIRHSTLGRTNSFFGAIDEISA